MCVCVCLYKLLHLELEFNENDRMTGTDFQKTKNLILKPALWKREAGCDILQRYVIRTISHNASSYLMLHYESIA